MVKLRAPFERGVGETFGAGDSIPLKRSGKGKDTGSW